jgi:hypothetical protein
VRVTHYVPAEIANFPLLLPPLTRVELASTARLASLGQALRRSTRGLPYFRETEPFSYALCSILSPIDGLSEEDRQGNCLQIRLSKSGKRVRSSAGEIKGGHP